jgi:hemolysin activation/secretion protein
MPHRWSHVSKLTYLSDMATSDIVTKVTSTHGRKIRSEEPYDRSLLNWRRVCFLCVMHPMLSQSLIRCRPFVAALRSTSRMGGLASFFALISQDQGLAQVNTATSPVPPAEAAPSEERFYIRHYSVKGSTKLPRLAVEKAIYPFMGPACTTAHVEKAAAELQKAYHEAGYKTVTVQIPEQDARRGVVTLQVTEGKVGRLRVKGARFFSPELMKQKLPSLAEGTVPDFDDVTKEVVALNRQDLEVLPEVRPGVEPGTFDVDMKVKDSAPMHGSLEFNNRYSPDTTEFRLNGGFSFSNLWQAGHSAGFNFQIAPERLEDAKIFSGYYLLPLTDTTSLMLNGVKQDSNLNTLGGVGVAGRGYVLGAKVNWTLPQTSTWTETQGVQSWSPERFSHSLGFGLDFKHFDEDISVGATQKSTPIEYFPLNLSYTASWLPDMTAKTKRTTELNLAAIFHPRGLGSDVREFDSKRYLATGNFFSLKGDLSHLIETERGWQLYSKLQGQWADVPLINSEQYSGGGLNNARGYLESSALGDQAIFGTVELRTPSLLRNSPPADPTEAPEREWRLHAFCDAGALRLNSPLPEQDDTFTLLSVGAGTRFTLWKHVTGSVDAGFPLQDVGPVSAGDILVTFRLGIDF